MAPGINERNRAISQNADVKVAKQLKKKNKPRRLRVQGMLAHWDYWQFPSKDTMQEEIKRITVEKSQTATTQRDLLTL